jgi:hypothetical protein
VIENITQVAIAMGKQQFQKKNTYKENQWHPGWGKFLP